MKIYRTVIALLVLAVLLVPQVTPVQSAPSIRDRTVNLDPGDTLKIKCPTKLVWKSTSRGKWNFLCRSGNAASNLHNNNEKNTMYLRPGDTVAISCPTKLVWKFAVRTGWSFVCRPAPATSTAVPTASATKPATQTPEPTATELSEPTATGSSEPTVTESSEPTATESSGPTATQTSTSIATQTSTPTTTLTPSATATKVTGGSIEPFKGAPACPTHDSNKWHGLWDYQRGCHYDHTHGDDPSLADKYFGTLGKLWGGATISYPFNSGPAENGLKHAGYKISVRMPGYHAWPACGTEDNTDITGDHSDNCVIASRTEYHIIGGLMDIVARYHSYWMEVYVCKPPYRQPQDCGIMRTGGLLDYGQLQAPHYNARVVRPGGTINFGNGITIEYLADGSDLPNRSGEPYVFSIPYSESELQSYRNNPPKATLTQAGKATIDQWSSNDFDCEPRPAGEPCHNQYTHVLFQVGDSFNLVDTQNLNTVRWICWGEPGCEYNGSMIGMNEIAIRVMQSWQANGGGFVTVNGYSDKWGNPRSDNTCTSISADCVPFILEHVPAGVAASRSDNKCECQVWEYDVYFNGKPSGWIKFPN